MTYLLLGLCVFVLTVVEVWVGNQHWSARMLARKCRTWRRRLRSAKYAMGFEAILCVWLFAGLENKWLMLLAIPGAGVGDLLDTGRVWQRFNKWLANRRGPKVSADDLARVEAARAQLEMEAGE